LAFRWVGRSVGVCVIEVAGPLSKCEITHMYVVVYILVKYIKKRENGGGMKWRISFNECAMVRLLSNIQKSRERNH
jgi:hypothetical protein